MYIHHKKTHQNLKDIKVILSVHTQQTQMLNLTAQIFIPRPYPAAPNGNFPQKGDSAIYPNVLQSLLWGPRKQAPLLWANAHTTSPTTLN